jgi:hypothetical protein
MMEALMAVLLLMVVASSSTVVAFQSISTFHTATANHHNNQNVVSTSASRRKSTSLHSVSSATAAAKAVSAAIIKDAEARATVAIETWSIEVTPFMEPNDADIIERLFMKRGDVAVLRIVGGQRRSSSSMDMDVSTTTSSITKAATATTKSKVKLNDYYTQLLSRGLVTDNEMLETQSDTSSSSILGDYGRRSRFVITHPDLILDVNTAEAQYTNMIRITNVNIKSCKYTFPDILASIGVHLDTIGDIVIDTNNKNDDENSGTVYIIVDPSVVTRCIRLLSKELMGVGISVSLCEENECMPPHDGYTIVTDMKLNRTTERQIGRKKYKDGYIRF